MMLRTIPCVLGLALLGAMTAAFAGQGTGFFTSVLFFNMTGNTVLMI